MSENNGTRPGGGRRVVVRGGTVVDSTGERRGDVFVEDGRVVAVGEGIDVPLGTIVLEASGCVVAPGLVDIHTHLREPGGEAAETVATGSRSAALGGYTAVVAMPNTEPAIDSAAVVQYVLELARGACADVAVAGAITVGRAGDRVAPLAEMAALGVRLFTDDGRGVQNADVLRQALEQARDLGIILAEHCQDEVLASGGHMHEGAWSRRLGIPAQPAAAEEAMLARDLTLVRETRAPMHFLHLSTAGSVELVRAAKAEGLPVTAEVTPHHLVLTDAVAASRDPLFKVAPPLRSAADGVALRAACREGVVDAIATDHAPHTREAKEAPFEEAPPGMIGLETALAVAFDAFVARPEDAEPLSLAALIALMSWRPAALVGLDRSLGHGGPLAPGARAHLCVFDPTQTWTVDRRATASRSHNSPFDGMTLTGRVRHTVLAGEPIVVDGTTTR
ncbi:MAG TPA: dihydroorotase [Acidimicrobiales bacterium]|nr:dihydroorotase [Acidimicrobiales bacterium]